MQAAELIGSTPQGSGSWSDKARLAMVRALRTFIQGVAAAFPAAGAGAATLSAGYWQTFGYSVLAAGITAIVSFLNNIASFLPDDPTQKPAG